MRDISKIRNDIDKIDRELLNLFKERLSLANDVAEFKMENRRPIFDRKREEEKLASLLKDEKDDFTKQGLSEFFSELMAINRKKQYKILAENGMMGPLNFKPIKAFDFSGKTAVFQGVPGAYSQEAALRFFGESVRIYPVDTWRNAMDAIRTGMADYAVLPIENSSAGIVSENYDLLTEFDVSIIGEQIIPINHCLLGLPGTDKSMIKTVYSHPQALMQCDDYLRTGITGVKTVALQNTAAAARKVMEDKDETQAAIAGSINERLYGLSILDERIQDDKSNETRFIVVSGEKLYLESAKNISLSFRLSNDKGTLYHTLSHFIFNGLSMSRIESRPIPGKVWEYRFFIDLEGNLMDENVQNALRGLQEETLNLRILGNY